MNNRLRWFNHYNFNSTTVYCLQIFIVLSGTTLGLRYLGHHELIIPVTLGAIATALTDFDDRLSIRLRNLVYVSFLFFVVSSVLEFLSPYPFLLIIYLSLSSGFLILLGSLGQRYATISFGTILLSIYTLFGLGEYQVWYQQPLYFVYGVIWYGLTSIIFYMIKPTLAVQDNLSQIFSALAKLLNSKSKLFDPDNHENVEQLLFDLSLENAQTVQRLNTAKASLLTRLKASRVNQNSIYWLHLYFVAQDIHEQVSANYLHYEQIQDNFSRSDLIFRIQKNIRLQAIACETLCQCILTHRPYQPAPELSQALDQLERSMQDWIRMNPDNIEVKNLRLILNNLHIIDDQLHNLNDIQYTYPARFQQHVDNLNLLDDDIHGIKDLWLKFRQHLYPQSALFRHAVRITFVFAAGSLISLLPFAKNGYWILLTGLFVCQVTYFATKSRLKLRTFGTLLGVILGMPILYFVPSVEGQLMITVICGVCFFYLRQKKYALATSMATLMVLLIFNLKGSGFNIILPRMMDTLLGCGIAWFAVSFIWPDWNFRNISNNIRNSTQASLDYFDAVVQQYDAGRTNSMDYRRTRRLAHNAQIELSSMISSLSAEPSPNPQLIHYAFRYLVYSHSQLSYISALGSHREKIGDQYILDLMRWCLNTLKQVLIEQRTLSETDIKIRLQEIHDLAARESTSEYFMLILKQISLLLETLPELVTLRRQLLEKEIR
ncbi:putative membrane protein (TIGR01666 family) [Acinetobacter baylyi]|uniref:Membrane protein (TIGR01666 family) n=1 Tax=Acinetobacter baylyi TaxID=202950 RepID=A0ABU0UWA2_ACIBI|nr:YccS family putative transporter [Acinetobacter baylyi]MDQ1208846.1 putative membrane protein (TIGR01666 family) [Acinetobacter baylyi]MDR6107561.1 putative membrane protein (TIGR01666 family) [Acinetobacter baylyi]MDR6185717.1 putative membrane protein (TIGR01666 family) [Acinetobacter baylyi]